MTTSTRHRNTTQRTIEPVAELRIFANIHCQTCRVMDFPISHNALALAIHNAYGLGDSGWALCMEFARHYTEEWFRREERQAYASVREASR